MAKGIQLCAFSPLGGNGTGWGKDWVMECDVLHEIAKAKGKSVAQVKKILSKVWSCIRKTGIYLTSIS